MKIIKSAKTPSDLNDNSKYSPKPTKSKSPLVIGISSREIKNTSLVSMSPDSEVSICISNKMNDTSNKKRKREDSLNPLNQVNILDMLSKFRDTIKTEASNRTNEEKSPFLKKSPIFKKVNSQKTLQKRSNDASMNDGDEATRFDQENINDTIESVEGSKKTLTNVSSM